MTYQNPSGNLEEKQAKELWAKVSSSLCFYSQHRHILFTHALAPYFPGYNPYIFQKPRMLLPFTPHAHTLLNQSNPLQACD